MPSRRRPFLVLIAAALEVATLAASPAGSSVPAARGPTSAQRKLVAAVPATIRPSCVPARPIPKSPSVAAITCDDGSGSALSFDQFKKIGALDSWYEREPSRFHVRGTTAHSPGQCPFNNQWSALGQRRGQVLCGRKADRSAAYEWTDEATLIFATAVRKDGDAAQLDGYWQRAGPCLAKDRACLSL